MTASLRGGARRPRPSWCPACSAVSLGRSAGCVGGREMGGRKGFSIYASMLCSIPDCRLCPLPQNPRTPHHTTRAPHLYATGQLIGQQGGPLHLALVLSFLIVYSILQLRERVRRGARLEADRLAFRRRVLQEDETAEWFCTMCVAGNLHGEDWRPGDGARADRLIQYKQHAQSVHEFLL
jgi:hypothetical protein